MKVLAKFLSLPANYKYICDSPNENEKRRRIEELRARFDGVGFFDVITGVGITDVIGSVSPTGRVSSDQSDYSSVSFSASGYMEDFTNPSGVYDDNDFTPERVESALNNIQRLVVREGVKESLTGYLTVRNNVIRRNKARKAETAKTFER